MRMHDRLDGLFRGANVAYVIPRDINTVWLTTLPPLPHGLTWPPFLLQEVFVVAFSGGKDSLALLNLVSRALPPNEFVVVFSNTGMELSTTIQSVEKAKRHWSSLKFYEAKSHLDPTDSWEEFGPPGRRMRWCCAVHKSVPTILLLREITGNYNVKAVVFDGVRAEESAARADRDEISVSAKSINQVNCSPILKWNSSELFLYLLHYRILLNDAYRIGFNRVGWPGLKKWGQSRYRKNR